jgi:hypothetical protein
VARDGSASPVPIGVIGGGLVAQAVHLPLLQRLDSQFRVTSLTEPDADVRRTVRSPDRRRTLWHRVGSW